MKNKISIDKAFEELCIAYQQIDKETKERTGNSYFRTSHGLWGASDLLDLFEFFLKIKLETFNQFADYGCGDGRITLLASLFTKATGIEGDEVIQVATNVKQELCKIIPQIAKAEFIQGDYYQQDHNTYDIIFLFPDHPFPEGFERKLLKEFTGYIIVYNQIHLPRKLPKGRTYWIRQVPIVSYPINVKKKNLFSASSYE